MGIILGPHESVVDSFEFIDRFGMDEDGNNPGIAYLVMHEENAGLSSIARSVFSDAKRALGKEGSHEYYERHKHWPYDNISQPDVIKGLRQLLDVGIEFPFTYQSCGFRQFNILATWMHFAGRADLKDGVAYSNPPESIDNHFQRFNPQKHTMTGKRISNLGLKLLIEQVGGKRNAHAGIDEAGMPLHLRNLVSFLDENYESLRYEGNWLIGPILDAFGVMLNNRTHVAKNASRDLSRGSREIRFSGQKELIAAEMIGRDWASLLQLLPLDFKVDVQGHKVHNVINGVSRAELMYFPRIVLRDEYVRKLEETYNLLK